MLEPVDEAAELEDADEDDGAEDLLPQPVITTPTTTVVTAQPATVTRAICMGLSFPVNDSVDMCTGPAAARRVVAKYWPNNAAPMNIPRRMCSPNPCHRWGGHSPPMLARGNGISFDSRGKELKMTAAMARAVRFDRYGGRDELYVVDIDMPSPGPGEVVVEVHAAGINPGEAAIRVGAPHDMLPATFSSGEGSDLAGVVTR